MEPSNESTYSIPARFRKMENTHILFWLLKDVGWCMGWKSLGLLMVIPTLSMAILITWRTRKMQAELAHNLAVAFWISANSYWMVSEFIGFDEVNLWHGIEGKHLAMIPFAAGVLILAYYYLFTKPKELQPTQAS
jgi:hypothetical protein